MIECCQQWEIRWCDNLSESKFCLPTCASLHGLSTIKHTKLLMAAKAMAYSHCTTQKNGPAVEVSCVLLHVVWEAMFSLCTRKLGGIIVLRGRTLLSGTPLWLSSINPNIWAMHKKYNPAFYLQLAHNGAYSGFMMPTVRAHSSSPPHEKKSCRIRVYFLLLVLVTIVSFSSSATGTCSSQSMLSQLPQDAWAS